MYIEASKARTDIIIQCARVGRTKKKTITVSQLTGVLRIQHTVHTQNTTHSSTYRLNDLFLILLIAISSNNNLVHQ